MDLYTNLMFKVKKRYGLWSRDPILKFRDLYNFWTNRAIRFKLGTTIEDGPRLRTDHKMTLKWE